MTDYGTRKAPANSGSIVQGEIYRFTVLTDRMIRMEYSETGKFVDEQTQIVVSRDFEVPEYTVNESDSKLEIITKYLIVTYDKKKFSSNGLTVQMRGNPYLRKTGIWFFGDQEFLKQGNLRGTASTLDNAVGDVYYRDSDDETKIWGEPDKKIELCYGIMSKNGFSVIDDSKSLLFAEDGWVVRPPEDHMDIYFLNYGRQYRECLNAFFTLTGKTPMLPRYALGNWWSRYYSYTQDEYMALMNRFRDEKIPIAVGIQDMGWHYVDIDPKYGKGWTGYTWNRELFPDPGAMMKELHDRGMHISLNVHPADGVRAHEEMYRDMAQELGVDYEHEVPVPFDVTDRAFMKAYFKYLHHPNEKLGVDFWWLDWQQGSNTRIPGYDPLWMLNHYHYLDNARNGKRPMDFSRYAGLGSHRYPIGFSGSTFITWESLDYQPFFTANATNVGYGWWSHDIGGHRNGYRDDELTTRWVQFGVFSPIMRLHSSDETFTGKEPWKFSTDAERVMRKFLTLRHKLVPYLYTMNYLFYKENSPLVQPLYYLLPEKEEAYQRKNEYLFGTELIVNPITQKSNPTTKTGEVKSFLPEGLWYDIFTGLRYQGGRTVIMHRDISSIPVLAKAGGIIPMQPAETVSSRTDNPEALEIQVMGGADGSFSLYEDDGISMDYEKGICARTEFRLDWTAGKQFTVSPVEGTFSLVPAVRSYAVRFYGIAEDAVKSVTVGGANAEYRTEYDRLCHILTITVAKVSSAEQLTIELREDTKLLKNNVIDNAYEAINRAQVPFATKESVFRLLCSKRSGQEILAELEAKYMSEEMKNVIKELLLAELEAGSLT